MGAMTHTAWGISFDLSHINARAIRRGLMSANDSF
jgi:hypothetical protein